MRTASTNDKCQEIMRQVSKIGLTVCAVQEVKRIGNDSRIIETTNPHTNKTENFEFHWSCPANARKNGVRIIFKIDPSVEVGTVTAINDRLLSATCSVNGYSLKFLVCYVPTNSSSDNSLLKNTRRDSKQQKLVVLGDMNAQMQISERHYAFRPEKIMPNASNNDNGDRLLD